MRPSLNDANHLVNWFLLSLGAGLLLARGGVRPVWALAVLVAGVGALLAVGVNAGPGLSDGPIWARSLGFIGLILASINIFGGFLVTQRMLAMYRKKG